MKQYLFRAAPLILVCCMFVFVLSPSASAESFDYNDLITDVVADGDNDIVSFQYPVDRSTWFFAFYDGSHGTLFQGGSCEVWLGSSARYLFECRPFGGQMDDFNNLRCDNIPDGTVLEGTYTAHYDGGSYSADQSGIIQWYSSSGSILSNQTFSLSSFPTTTSVGTFSVELEKPTGATSFAVLLRAENFTASYDGTVYLELNSCRFSMSISSLYRQQQLTGKTNELLDEVSKQLAEQGKTMQDVLYQQEQTNDKLDKLPGQIGDEMQGVLDQEKEEANNTGNGSIDDMIELIPDYSTGLIKGIENLAGSLGYEGTECKLTMPALRIPALPGVTPEPITFMEEQEVDLEVWFNRMPSEIMAVTKAMFDIAVVIFCFIEFYDLISQLSNGAKRLEKE